MQLGLPFGMRYQYVKFISLVGPAQSKAFETSGLRDFTANEHR